MTRRRVTLATLAAVLTGATVVDNWRLTAAAACLLALGWIGSELARALRGES